MSQFQRLVLQIIDPTLSYTRYKDTQESSARTRTELTPFKVLRIPFFYQSRKLTKGRISNRFAPSFEGFAQSHDLKRVMFDGMPTKYYIITDAHRHSVATAHKRTRLSLPVPLETDLAQQLHSAKGKVETLLARVEQLEDELRATQIIAVRKLLDLMRKSDAIEVFAS